MAGYRIFRVKTVDGSFDVVRVPDGIPVKEALAKAFPGGKLVSPRPVYQATYDPVSGGYWTGD